MASSEAMTSSTRSFAYSYRLVKKCFVKIFETSKCHNFLIFQPIFIRFSLFCSQNFTLSSEIKVNLFRSSPLSTHHTDPVITTYSNHIPLYYMKLPHVDLMARLFVKVGLWHLWTCLFSEFVIPCESSLSHYESIWYFPFLCPWKLYLSHWMYMYPLFYFLYFSFQLAAFLNICHNYLLYWLQDDKVCRYGRIQIQHIHIKLEPYSLWTIQWL